MKFNRFGAMTALIAGAGFVGCSGAQGDGQQREGNSSVGFNLRTPEGVVITEVSYDLNTAAGADVVTGIIPVPNDNSVINGSINALGVGSYSLLVDATGSFNGAPVDCEAAPAPFSLAANENLALPQINLVCTIVNEVGRDTGNVSFTVGVTIEQVNVVRDVLETFVVAPTSTIAQIVGGACVFPPMGITVANADPAIAYSWAATPDGTFAFNASNTVGRYTCASNGSKTLTVTATLGTVTGTRNVLVSCSGCDVVPPDLCGNGTVDPGESCDESTPRCTDCAVTPVCGDAIVDAPEACDAGPTPSTTCDATCQIIPPVLCGNGTIDAGEECDPGPVPTATCDAACQDIPPPIACGNGVVETGEECDPGPVPTATCDAQCLIIPPPQDLCGDCITANPDIGPLQTELCAPNTLCTAVQQCVLANDCFLPIAATCYCGPDVDACENPAFVPVGPCVNEIRAAAGNDSPNNALVLERFFNFDFPLGVGLGILDEATRVCTNQCFAP